MIGKTVQAIAAIAVPIVSVGCVLSAADNHLFSTGASTPSQPASSGVMLLSCAYDITGLLPEGCPRPHGPCPDLDPNATTTPECAIDAAIQALTPNPKTPGSPFDLIPKRDPNPWDGLPHGGEEFPK
jgi:hypothetical protein